MGFQWITGRAPFLGGSGLRGRGALRGALGVLAFLGGSGFANLSPCFQTSRWTNVSLAVFFFRDTVLGSLRVRWSARCNLL